MSECVGPDHCNDPDLLEVGNDNLTVNKSTIHFALCMLVAPFMGVNDLRNVDKETIDILTNENEIPINQDKLVWQAFKTREWYGIEMWAKPISNNNFASCFFNRNEPPVS